MATMSTCILLSMATSHMLHRLSRLVYPLHRPPGTMLAIPIHHYSIVIIEIICTSGIVIRGILLCLRGILLCMRNRLVGMLFVIEGNWLIVLPGKQQKNNKSIGKLHRKKHQLKPILSYEQHPKPLLLANTPKTRYSSTTNKWAT